jgi:hypothetical protein
MGTDADGRYSYTDRNAQLRFPPNRGGLPMLPPL